jgi:hypothetical protein
MKKLYKEFCEFTDRLKNQQGYVNLLIELSPKLLESSIRYGNNIAIWANKVETRYKEFFNIMTKVQQAHGIQTTINSANNSNNLSISSLSSTSSLLASPSINIQSVNNLSSATGSVLSSSGYDSTISSRIDSHSIEIDDNLVLIKSFNKYNLIFKSC